MPKNFKVESPNLKKLNIFIVTFKNKETVVFFTYWFIFLSGLF